MDKLMQVLRYSLFALFIICNAIICSVAVWNLSLAQPLGWNLQVDAYLAFVGAFALTFSFTLIFIEIARPAAFTTKVWFECAWVGIFWVMELAGAAAVTAIVPNVLCNPRGVLNSETQSRIVVENSCSSTNVLLAFSWICTIILLGYLLLLTISTIVHRRKNPNIWFGSARNIPWSDSGSRLASAPPTPTLPRFLKKSPTIVAPQPRRAPAATTLYAYRSGLSSEYEIEHYRPPSPSSARPVPPIPAAAPPHHVLQSTRHAADNFPVTSFYPQHMQSALISQPFRVEPPAQTRNLPRSPPPLGDWPRPDAVAQPLRKKQRQPPPSRSTAPTEPESVAAGSSQNPSPPRSRPSGPRRRSNSNSDNRPPPLDLSTISSFKENRQRPVN